MTKLLRYFVLSTLVLSSLQSCKDSTNTILEKQDAPIAYSLKGEAFNPENALSNKQAAIKLNQLSLNDSINMTIKTQITEVCKAKGCWMTFSLPNNESVRVTFKDYAFFVPKDIAGETVIIQGKAIKQEVSVENLRHYAQDKGASQEDILAITTPEVNYSIVANGVLIEK